MAASDGLPPHVRAPVPPNIERPPGTPRNTGRSPKGKCWTSNGAPRHAVVLVGLQIIRRTGTIILASCVEAVRLGKKGTVMRERFGRKNRPRAVPGSNLILEPGDWIGSNHPF